MAKQKTTDLAALMTERFSGLGTLIPRDVGDFSVIRGKGMRFNISAFEVEGLGYLSVIRMRAFLGLMKMDTLVFTPVYRDAPLFSMDRILAFGNDTLMLEMYDLTLNGAGDLSALDKVKKTLADLPDGTLTPHWYDYLALPQNLVKKGKHLDARYTACVADYTDEYLKALLAAPACERDEKLARIDFYVDGLFTKGSPTVEQFSKILSREQAYALYSRFVFSSRPD